MNNTINTFKEQTLKEIDREKTIRYYQFLLEEASSLDASQKDHPWIFFHELEMTPILAIKNPIFLVDETQSEFRDELTETRENAEYLLIWLHEKTLAALDEFYREGISLLLSQRENNSRTKNLILQYMLQDNPCLLDLDFSFLKRDSDPTEKKDVFQEFGRIDIPHFYCSKKTLDKVRKKIISKAHIQMGQKLDFSNYSFLDTSSLMDPEIYFIPFTCAVSLFEGDIYEKIVLPNIDKEQLHLLQIELLYSCKRDNKFYGQCNTRFINITGNGLQVETAYDFSVLDFLSSNNWPVELFPFKIFAGTTSQPDVLTLKQKALKTLFTESKELKQRCEGKILKEKEVANVPF